MNYYTLHIFLNRQALYTKSSLFEFAKKLKTCAQAPSYKNIFNSFYCLLQLPALFAVLVDFYFQRKRERITCSHSIPSQRIIFNGIWLTYDIPMRHCFVFLWKIVFVLDQIHFWRLKDAIERKSFVRSFKDLSRASVGNRRKKMEFNVYCLIISHLTRSMA